MISIFGTLDSAPVNSTPSIFVIYFLILKSNSFTSSGNLSISIIGCVFCSVAFAYNVIFVLEFTVPFSYVIAFVLAVLIK